MNTVQYTDGRYPYATAIAVVPGQVVTRPCGTLAVLDGMDAAKIGDIIQPAPLLQTKIVEMVAASADTWSAGATLYWDAGNSRVVATSTGNVQIGAACRAKTNGQTRALVNCNVLGLDLGVRHIRTRFTIAQINAGATLLAAKSGTRYRMVAASAIAIGGAAGAVTTVDILGTQSASGVKLVAFAQANLTQNTQLNSGGTGGTILAGGVSYAPNDSNTAINVGKTGSDVTTATHIDILLSYVEDLG